VGFVAFQVGGIGQELMIGTDGEVAQPEIFLAFGEHVRIEQNFLDGIGASVLAALNGIRFPLFGARVIKIVVALHRHGNIGFLNAPEDFLV